MLDFYPKLALNNLRKNKDTYWPYMLTSIVCIATYYIMQSIAMNRGLLQVSGGAVAVSIFFLGTVVIAIFCVALLFYTNSFLIKRRKKELGLYCVLGLEKHHVALVLFFETLFSALFCLILGLIFGILFSKALFLALLYVLDFSTPIAFTISIPSLITTLVLFLLLYAVLFLYNATHVQRARPVELLRSTQTGEREPRASWLLTLLGLICLGIGYFIAVTVKEPLNALLVFFGAVLLVIAGTFCLFTSGSIALLKLLRRNKTYYYQPRHFISVSGLMYRMKQNAAGLASICILSTMVLVTISTTVCLYIGRDSMISSLNPTSISGRVTLLDDRTPEQLNTEIDAALEQDGIRPDVLEQRFLWRYADFYALRDKNVFINAPDDTKQQPVLVSLIPLEDYNAMTGQQLTLDASEALLFTNDASFSGNTAQIGSETLHILQQLDVLGPYQSNQVSTVQLSYEFVVSDFTQLQQIYRSATGQNAELEMCVYLDTQDDSALQKAIASALFEHTPPETIYSINARATVTESWNSMYGSFLFLGLFLGSLFLMATVLIIYYKQISEGFDDHDRFSILQKVGMSKKEVRATINKQILLVFFLPLAMAFVHMAFAYNVICNILVIFGMTDRLLFLVCCLVTFFIFSLLYLFVYRMTAHTYYRLVEA